MEDSEHSVTDQMEKPLRLLRLKEVKMRVGLGRSTIYRWISEGNFPKPVKLGMQSVAWRENDIDCWVSSRTNAGKDTNC